MKQALMLKHHQHLGTPSKNNLLLSLSSDKQAYGYGAFDCPPCSGLLLWRNPSAEAQNITFTLRAALALPQVPFLDRDMSQYAWQSAKHDSHCFQAWPGGARLRLSGQKTLVSPFQVPSVGGGKSKQFQTQTSDIVGHRQIFRLSSDVPRLQVGGPGPADSDPSWEAGLRFLPSSWARAVLLFFEVVPLDHTLPLRSVPQILASQSSERRAQTWSRGLRPCRCAPLRPPPLVAQ